MSDYPLAQDFVIIDCPATLEPLPLTALAASSHVLIPIQPEYKASQSAAAMIEWYYFNCKRLRLKPTPKILGIVPTRWKSDWGAHKLDETEQNILLLLLRFQQNPASVDANIFPCLRLSSDLKIAIRESGLGANHARTLQKLNSQNLKNDEPKANKIRQNITLQVLQEKLTMAETRSLVTKTITKYAPDKNVKPDRKISSLIQNISATKVDNLQKEQLQDLLTVLEAKVGEI